MNDEEKEQGELVLKPFKYGLIVFLALVLVFGTIVTIPAGHRGVVLKFGAVEDKIFGEGIHLKMPIAEEVKTIDIRTQKYEAIASAATKDLLDVTTKVVVNYHLQDNVVNKLYQEVGVDYETRLIYPAVQEEVKATTARFDATNLITERPMVKEKIEVNLKERLMSRGIFVETISIIDLSFPVQFNDAITAKQTAVQRAIEAQNKLEQVKFEAQQVAATAKGKAEATVTEAKGQADAIELINKQLDRSPQYISYLATTKWDGQLPLVTGGALPLIQLPNGGTR